MSRGGDLLPRETGGIQGFRGKREGGGGSSTIQTTPLYYSGQGQPEGEPLDASGVRSVPSRGIKIRKLAALFPRQERSSEKDNKLKDQSCVGV